LANDNKAEASFPRLLKNWFFTPVETIDSKFPTQDWHTWRDICRERWDFFSGKVWEETSSAGIKDGKQAEKYPLHINPIRTFALKHAYVLFGEVSDGAVNLVRSRILPKKNEVVAKEVAHEAEEALERVWYENNGRSLLTENGLLSQFLGGCVFKVSWRPDLVLLPSGVSIERIIPDYFVGVPDGSDMWNLREAWTAQPVSTEEAKTLYNVDVSEHLVTGPENQALLLEHWTRDSYRVSIEGKVARVRMPNGELQNLEGNNPIGVVPFVVIPHERAGDLFGLSLVDSAKALSREYNARMADAGDALREEARVRYVLKNSSQTVRHRQLEPGILVHDLGVAPPNSDPPSLDLLASPRISSEMNNFNAAVLAQLRRDCFVPPVADGEDEGSQRSALTLAFRMWPLTSHVRAERNYWSEGLNLVNEMILMILDAKNPMRVSTDGVDTSLLKINQTHLGHLKRQEWAPMIPRDREALVNELILRSGANHISLESALGSYGDIDDIQEEIKRIVAWMEHQSVVVADQPETDTEEDAEEAEEAEEAEVDAPEVGIENE